MHNFTKNINTKLLSQQLKKTLLQPLPGNLAHEMMMPAFRKIIDWPTTQPTKSAVIILMYQNNEQIFFPIIRRPWYNGHHSGEMALPGGKFDPTDNSLIDTALRECYEEVGVIIKPEQVIGTLSGIKIPITNMEVLPVVAISSQCLNFKINANEVAGLFSVSLNELLNPANKKLEQQPFNNQMLNVPYYKLNEQKVWGATAMILSELEFIIRGILAGIIAS